MNREEAELFVKSSNINWFSIYRSVIRSGLENVESLRADIIENKDFRTLRYSLARVGHILPHLTTFPFEKVRILISQGFWDLWFSFISNIKYNSLLVACIHESLDGQPDDTLSDFVDFLLNKKNEISSTLRIINQIVYSIAKSRNNLLLFNKSFSIMGEAHPDYLNWLSEELAIKRDGWREQVIKSIPVEYIRKKNTEVNLSLVSLITSSEIIRINNYEDKDICGKIAYKLTAKINNFSSKDSYMLLQNVQDYAGDISYVFRIAEIDYISLCEQAIMVYEGFACNRDNKKGLHEIELLKNLSIAFALHSDKNKKECDIKRVFSSLIRQAHSCDYLPWLFERYCYPLICVLDTIEQQYSESSDKYVESIIENISFLPAVVLILGASRIKIPKVYRKSFIIRKSEWQDSMSLRHVWEHAGYLTEPLTRLWSEIVGENSLDEFTS